MQSPPRPGATTIAARHTTRVQAGIALAALLGTALPACNGGIYLRDGVTDGDTFYLSPRVLEDDDPVLQSWAGYSLSLSACKLATGGDNPARASSFECERTARQHLLDAWQRHRGDDSALADDYLDVLTAVRDAGWLDEYIVRYLDRPGWQHPPDLDAGAFRDWMKRHYPHHRPRTRITGSWNYAARVRALP